ncbi:hypothetical protein Pmani_026853 [Petrolisthes manimaculis]|uniref:L-aminoadipate-semialdehyde dehydrogenase-phosphopantetheinyl transferase n=1 Tax=Petrolisthes manimaculis TaxID=1843537 RepID=A0AAE1TXF1_9EUCA|nr:hypothetical protein Pmani_026853 [Petrolisthes manimaculis]
MESIRWAFNTRLWAPNKGDWMTALSLIQPEEKERISKFVFRKDAKSSIAGRLMLRKFASEVLGLPWSDIKFGRTDKGRPFLVNSLPENPDVDFNVSHQGSWAVLAANCGGSKIGVDVMELEYSGGKNIPEFFHTMRRQFTSEEWSHIYSFPTESTQLASFYRHWCLKEGVVKALGFGIGFELQRVSFQLTTQELSTKIITLDTQVKIDGILDNRWQFEETLLDPSHSVAVARQFDSPQNNTSTAGALRFIQMSFDDLIASGDQMTKPDEAAAEEFINKEETPW